MFRASSTRPSPTCLTSRPEARRWFQSAVAAVPWLRGADRCFGRLEAQLARWLKPRGLAFSEAKTRIAALTEDFDFLGFNFRRYPNGHLLIKPGTP